MKSPNTVYHCVKTPHTFLHALTRSSTVKNCLLLKHQHLGQIILLIIWTWRPNLNCVLRPLVVGGKQNNNKMSLTHSVLLLIYNIYIFIWQAVQRIVFLASNHYLLFIQSSGISCFILPIENMLWSTVPTVINAVAFSRTLWWCHVLSRKASSTRILFGYVAAQFVQFSSELNISDGWLIKCCSEYNIFNYVPLDKIIFRICR